jgi:hypothetical protein
MPDHPRSRAARRKLPAWLAKWFARRAEAPSDLQRARDLIAAIDAGGIPLNPAKINQIARSLGLEVSRNAPVEQTIERIRAALMRSENACSGADGLR